METKLSLIRELARKDNKQKFNNLSHLLNRENLKDCLFMIKAGKATGIDGVTVEEYETNIGKNLDDLIARMKRQAYKPQSVKRVYIPKANGKLRPLGIPATEDKLVQIGIARIMNTIYENDFLEQSYGFRPKRSCHEALKEVDKQIMKMPVNYIIDADIKGFFDNVNHEWLMKFLQERITDFNLLRIIKRFLISGVMEEGKYSETDKGTPQGGIISPILANIYLHYVLDLWIEKVVKKRSKGYVEFVRYADDFIIFAQYEEEAKAILEALKKRLIKFNLELSEDKTKILRFGRGRNMEKKGTFNFLGFTHYMASIKGLSPMLNRKTDRKKFVLKLKEMYKWLKMTVYRENVKKWWKTLKAKLIGHYAYYGIKGNSKSISKFLYMVTKMVFKVMNRMSQRRRFNWRDFNKYLKIYKLPKAKTCKNVYYNMCKFDEC